MCPPSVHWKAFYLSSGELFICDAKDNECVCKDYLSQPRPTSIAIDSNVVYVTHKTQLLQYKRRHEGSWGRKILPQAFESKETQVIASQGCVLLYGIKDSKITITSESLEPEKMFTYWVDGEVEKCEPVIPNIFLVAYKDWQGIRRISHICVDEGREHVTELQSITEHDIQQQLLKATSPDFRNTEQNGNLEAKGVQPRRAKKRSRRPTQKKRARGCKSNPGNLGK